MACNVHTWFNKDCLFILEGSEKKVESVISDDDGTSAGASCLDQGTLIVELNILEKRSNDVTN